MKRTGAACLVLAGCRALLGIDDPSLRSDASAPDAERIIDAAAPMDVPDAAGYHASAVHFDGNAYLTRSGLENTPISPAGTFSVWLKFDGGDGTQQFLAAAAFAVVGGVARQADDHFEFVMQACGGAKLLDFESNSTWTTASGWIHVLAAWDVNQGKALLYINDKSDLTAATTIAKGSICYDVPAWGLGGLNPGTLDADVADMYASLGTFIDISDPTKRLLFNTPANKPVDLGAHCATPTGTVPTACFIGSAIGWSTNEGSGGPFTAGGDPLTNAITSPSD